MNIILDHSTTFFILACFFGVFMAWGIGANDVANAMGTSVGSKALTIQKAVIIAAVFEFLGAYLAGGSVTETIRKGIIDPNLPVLTEKPHLLVYGMLSSLLAAGTWLLVASRFGWPVSTTHSIIGAIVGFASIGVSYKAVDWSQVYSIVFSWVISPVVSGALSYLIFMSIQRYILDTKHPFDNAKKYLPVYMFLMGFIMAFVTLKKGLQHVGLLLNNYHSILFSIVFGLILMLLGKLCLGNIRNDKKANIYFQFTSVEKIFGMMMVFTACSMAFSHGSNDVANAVGPIAAIISITSSGGEITSSSELPTWILFLGGVGIVIGLSTYGYRVMATIGTNITALTPSRGFSAELSAATTVAVASGFGLPISTTHTLVGAVLGVGIARGIAALNIQVIRSIFMSWLITLPAGAGLAILFYHILRVIFGS